MKLEKKYEVSQNRLKNMTSRVQRLEERLDKKNE